MNKTSRAWRGPLLGATAIMSGWLPVHAQALRSGVDLSLEGEATSNPYLDEDTSEWVGAGTVEIRPWLSSESATDRVELEGFARGRAFSSTYDFEDSLGGTLRATSRVSARTSYFGRANVLSTSARSTFSRFGRPGASFDTDPFGPGTPIAPGDTGLQPLAPIGSEPGPLVPGPGTLPIVPVVDDLTLVGLQGRTTTMSLLAGMSRQLDTVSSLNASVGYDRLWVSEDAVSGYESANVNLGYTRALSARTTAGVAASVGQARYDAGVPKTTTLGANATVQHRFDENWSLNAAVGVQNTRSDALGVFPAVNDTGLIGSVAACRTDALSRLCLSLARSQQPSSLGEVRTSDAINVSYSARLSARDRLDLYGNYGRSAATGDASAFTQDLDIASVGGTYTRLVSERLDGYAFGRVSRSYGGFLSEEPGLSFGVGVRYRLGARR